MASHLMSKSETLDTNLPVSKNTWFWYLLLSVVVNILFGILVPPHWTYDSAKFLLTASAMLDGSFRVKDLLIENVIGYPALVAGAMWLAGLLGLEYMTVLVVVQVAMAVATNAAVLVTAARLTRNPVIYVPAALLGVLSIETKMFSLTVMTETFYFFCLSWALALFVTALAKRDFRLANAAIIAGGLTGLIRPLGFIMPLLFWFYWWLREWLPALWSWRRLPERQDHGLDRQSDRSPRRGRTLVLRPAASLLLAITVAGAVSLLSRDPHLGTRERLSILWITSVQLNDELYQRLTQTDAFAQFKGDYFAWVDGRQVPPDVSLEPAWTPTPHWEYFDYGDGAVYKAIRWWKVPPWVLMTQRNLSREDALAWQGKMALDLILSHPGGFFKQVVRNVQASLYRQQPLDLLALAQVRSMEPGVLTSLRLRFLNRINDFHRWLSPPIEASVGFKPSAWVVLPMIWWTFSLLAGMIAGFSVYRRWEYALIVLVVLFHVVVNPTLSGYAARYRFPVEIFSGLFTVSWACWVVWAIARLRLIPGRNR